MPPSGSETQKGPGRIGLNVMITLNKLTMTRTLSSIILKDKFTLQIVIICIET